MVQLFMMNRILTNPPYLFFILSVIFSQIAINMLNVILLFLAYYLTSSNFLVSLVILSFVIPQILLSFLGGVLADVVNKKSILLYGNTLRALFLIPLFLSAKPLFLIYFVSFVTSVITQFYIPAETPLIPKLVEKRSLAFANSLFGVGLFGSIVGGYVLAGPSIQLLGRSYVFILIIALFLLAALFIHFIPKSLTSYTDKVVHPSKKVFTMYISDAFKSTYHLLTKAKEVTGALFLLGFSQIMILTLVTVVPGYAQTVLGVAAENLSLLLFAPSAFGMILSSFLVSGILAKYKAERLMNVGVFMAGIGICLFPLTPQIVPILSFFVGFASALIFIPSQTVIQAHVPEDFRSKVYGLLFSMIGAFSLFPVLATGGIADILGVETVLFLIGLFVIIVGLTKVKLWG